MTVGKKIAMLSLSAALLTASLLGAGPPTLEVEALEPAQLSFDLRQLAEGKTPAEYSQEVWCPTSEEFSIVLDSRQDLPDRGSRIVPMGPGGPDFLFSNGVIILEDDGNLLRNDRLFDLPMETLEFIPTPSGYTVSWIPSAYESDPGSLIIDDLRSWGGVGLDLQNFTFPFGGVDRTRIYVLTNFTLFFELPEPPGSDYLCSRGCWLDQSEVLRDRIPRVAPLQQGTSCYGWNAFYREEADRAVFTWRAAEGGIDVDVQTVLFADGRIRFNYARLQGVGHGAPSVVTGNAAWWSDLCLAGSATDPAGDVTVPAPDGPAMDLVGLTANQVAGSEVLQVDLALANPLPSSTDDLIYYYLTIKDEPDDTTPIGGAYFRWDNGAWTYQGYAAEMVGNALRFHLNLLELGLTDNDLTLDFVTFRGAPPWDYADQISIEATFTTPPGPVMLDLSGDLPATIDDRPIFEVFSLPELMPHKVRAAMEAEFPDLFFDGLAIYQNFTTDIIFFAGGYHTGGPASADGIGRGSADSPHSPSLLHVNDVYRVGALDWAMTVLTHEFAHRWLFFASIMENGQRTYSLGPRSHPAAWVHMPAVEPVFRPRDYSCMGGSWWTDNGGGTFTSEPEDTGKWSGFTWDELYLMGLAGPWEVPDWWYIANTDPPQRDAYWPPGGVTVTGDRIPVSIDQLIEAEGPRWPAFPTTRSDFFVPLVLVIRPGVFTQDEFDFVQFLCENWSDSWSRATAYRSTVRCAYSPPDTAITSPGTSGVTIAPGGALFLRGTGHDPDGDDYELTWDFGGVAPQTQGEGPHGMMFPEEGVFVVSLSAIDETGMSDPTPDRLTVTVECDSAIPPDEVQRLMVAREDQSLRFTWEDLNTGPSEYLLLRSEAAPGPFMPAASTPSGLAPGLLFPEQPAGLLFYEVGAWYNGCLGPF